MFKRERNTGVERARLFRRVRQERRTLPAPAAAAERSACEGHGYRLQSARPDIRELSLNL